MQHHQFERLLKKSLAEEDMSTSSLKYIMGILKAANSKYTNRHYMIEAVSEKDAKGKHIGYKFKFDHPNRFCDFRLPFNGCYPIKRSANDRHHIYS